MPWASHPDAGHAGTIAVASPATRRRLRNACMGAGTLPAEANRQNFWRQWRQQTAEDKRSGLSWPRSAHEPSARTGVG